MEPAAGDRLIVALDVPTAHEASKLVDELDGVVSFFKVGWQLFIGGEWKDVLAKLRGKSAFVDLKVPGDIGATIQSVVEVCVTHGVKFLTLSDSVTPQAIEAARRGRRGLDHPKLLMVPYLSSLDEKDLPQVRGASPGRLDDHILERARSALGAGCDGLIASGEAISLLRRAHPQAILVSPGIRPAGSPVDDHRRFSTPGDAIRSGADYLVVGRPIRSHLTPEGRRRAAEEIVHEIDAALRAKRPPRPDEAEGLPRVW